MLYTYFAYAITVNLLKPVHTIYTPFLSLFTAFNPFVKI